MTKSEALSHFGGPEASAASRVSLMAAALGITRTAIYMWPEDEIPALRALQIEKLATEGRFQVANQGSSGAPAQ